MNGAIAMKDGTLRLKGELRMSDATQIWRDLQRAARLASDELTIDLREATVIDGAIMSLVLALRAELTARGIRSRLEGASARIAPLVHLYRGDEPPPALPVRPRTGLVVQLGLRVAHTLKSARGAVIFVGQVAAATVKTFSQPRTANWRAVPRLAERAGIDGVPIVVLLNFLVGFVMAFQSARQLELYGANIFVADVVGISVTRELAPLMTAIIISGRSGAAYAAELGTMRVSEEIDALRTMGFSPAEFLILPRVVALASVAPLLVLLGDVVGVIGGAVVAGPTLDVSFRAYLAELQAVVLASDVWTGLVKSVAFAIAIALIGCQQGFAARGAAAGVGRGTTTTVVLCLFTVVIVDTLLTMLFRMFGA